MAENGEDSVPTLAPAAVGIRLGAGTLTLAVCRLGPGFEPYPTVVAGDSGERTTPAAVALANGEWVMGDAAVQTQVKNPKAFFGNLLPLVGTEVSDATLAKFTKGVSASRQADGQVLLQPCTAKGEPEGAPKRAADMLTMLLGWFKRLADENAGGPVAPCVLTVPAPFTAQQRSAVAACGAAAGFHVLQVLSEPTAVVVGHRADEAPLGGHAPSGAKAQRCVVVDLGRSGLDVTVLTVNRGVVAVEAHQHTQSLSGALLVEALAAFGAKMFARKSGGVDPLESSKSAAKLRAACEGAMRFLSTAADANLEVESLCDGLDLRQRVTRARFEDLCGDLWPQLDVALDQALTSAGTDRAGVDRCFVAGGASRVPKFVARLNSLVPPGAAAECTTVPPDEGAALGAARQASLLVWDEFEGFRPAYREDQVKLHEIVPAHAAPACLSAGVALVVAKGSPVVLLSPGAALPLHGHLVVVPAAALGSPCAAGEALAVDLAEVEAGAGGAVATVGGPLATLTLDLNKEPLANLAATLDVTAAGEITLTLRALVGTSTLKSKAAAGSEVSVTIPAP